MATDLFDGQYEKFSCHNVCPKINCTLLTFAFSKRVVLKTRSKTLRFGKLKLGTVRLMLLAPGLPAHLPHAAPRSLRYELLIGKITSLSAGVRR